MFQIDIPTAVATMPTPGSAGSPGFFTSGNAATGLAATIIDQDFMNNIMMELVNIVSALGGAPDKSKNNQIATLLVSTFLQASSFGFWTPYTGSTTITVPSGMTKFECYLTGGGGGAAGCTASGSTGSYANVSGGGGGAAGSIYIIIGVNPGDKIQISPGSGGSGGAGSGSGTPGGATTLSVNNTLLATAGGGSYAAWANSTQSTGGSPGGGTINSTSGVLSSLVLTGGYGCDGQTGQLIFAGFGGASLWGGGGRAGNGGGLAGLAPGSGGGGAYNTASGSNTGGAGGAGLVLGRLLP